MGVRTLSSQKYNSSGTLNRFVYGRSQSNPAASASQMAALGGYTDGNYWITINNVSTECYVNFTLNGGPYILTMTTSGTGSGYGYDATVWTDTSGGSTTALDPTSAVNAVDSSFYYTATTRTCLVLYQNSNTYSHYLNHTSGTPRALANGSAGTPSTISPDGTTITGGNIIPALSPARPGGWGAAMTGAGFSAMNWGATFYRYGWSHGTPDPSQFGYCRFGWSGDQDASDSRDRLIGIGIKNGGGGPVGSVAYSAGYTDYAGGVSNTLRAWLYIAN
jgi:hypothetical protein